jgi:DNA-binding transcriptional MerR regulator
MAHYSIKDLERLSGIKAHTIRIWEKRYSLVDPARTDTNIRTYSDEDLKKILNVSILNRYGIKISHIAALSDQEISEKIQIISRDSSDYESLIENLLIAMVDVDEQRVESLLSRAIMQIGFEDCILKIIYPFFDKIGVLWQTGAINPAQEHFISHLIRQKLITAIDSLMPVSHPDPKHFLLFLPEGELHELGLLFYSYIIKKRGHRVTYLGQWVPLRDMQAASSVMDFDYLLTSLIIAMPSGELPAYLKNLSHSFPGKTIFVSGRQTRELNDPLPAGIIKLNKVDDIFPHIS